MPPATRTTSSPAARMPTKAFERQQIEQVLQGEKTVCRQPETKTESDDDGEQPELMAAAEATERRQDGLLISGETHRAAPSRRSAARVRDDPESFSSLKH